MNIILRKRLAIIFSLASVIVLLISGYLSYVKYQTAFRENSNIIETYQTIRAANQTLISINEAALDVSTFLFSKNPETIKKLPEIIISAQLSMANLYQLTQYNSLEIQLVRKLKIAFDKKVDFLKSIIQEYSSGKKESAIKMAADENRLQLTADITQAIIEIKKIEIGQLDESIAYYQINKIKADKFFIIAGILNMLFILFNFMFTRKFLD